MQSKISKKKIPKVLNYLSEIRKVLYEARDKIENISRQMFNDTGYRSYYVDHALFLFSLSLEDLRKERQVLEDRLKRKRVSK